MPHATTSSILISLIVIFFIDLLLDPYWLVPRLELEAFIIPLTRHAQLNAQLLGYVQELQNPLLDHLSGRVVRSAAGLAKLDVLSSDLQILSDQLLNAKILAMELGVDIWSTGSTTHTELTYVLSSLPSSPYSASAARLNRSTEYVAGKLVHLRTSAAATHTLLLSAHGLGVGIVHSAEWKTFEKVAGATQRVAWLWKQVDDNSRLSASARDTMKAIERCGELAILVERVQGDVEAMLQNLRNAGARVRGARPRESSQLLRMTDELREILAGLEADVKRTQYKKT